MVCLFQRRALVSRGAHYLSTGTALHQEGSRDLLPASVPTSPRHRARKNGSGATALKAAAQGLRSCCATQLNEFKDFRVYLRVLLLCAQDGFQVDRAAGTLTPPREGGAPSSGPSSPTARAARRRSTMGPG